MAENRWYAMPLSGTRLSKKLAASASINVNTQVLHLGGYGPVLALVCQKMTSVIDLVPKAQLFIN